MFWPECKLVLHKVFWSTMVDDLAKLINRHWAYSLLKRMDFVWRKAPTLNSKYTVADFAILKKPFLQSVVETITMEEISPQLVFNWDRTGVTIVPSSSWTMEERGWKRTKLVGIKYKCQIMAVFCCTIQGDFLPVHLIYEVTTISITLNVSPQQGGI